MEAERLKRLAGDLSQGETPEDPGNTGLPREKGKMDREGSTVKGGGDGRRERSPRRQAASSVGSGQ